MDERTIARFWAKVDRLDAAGCWEWTARRHRQGYGEIMIGRRKTKAHRVSWTIARGPIPDGVCVLHRCDNPACCNPDHLFLGTQADNIHDMVRKGRQGTGNRSGARPNCKLTPEIAAAIRKEWSERPTQKTLAQRYGVSQGAVSLVVRKKTWM
jgi:hypothetical protein